MCPLSFDGFFDAARKYIHAARLYLSRKRVIGVATTFFCYQISMMAFGKAKHFIRSMEFDKNISD